MFQLCCGVSRNDGDSDTETPKRRMRPKKHTDGSQWLSEASNSPWLESDQDIHSPLHGPRNEKNDECDEVLLTVEVLKAKRLRSGYQSVHFQCPFVRVLLSDGRDDGKLLCKTGVGKQHKKEDAVTWNFVQKVNVSNSDIASRDAVLRFEILDADDSDMLCVREFSGQDLVDLINKDGTMKKTVKLANGSGVPARSGKRPSLHFSVRASPNPFGIGKTNRNRNRNTNNTNTNTNNTVSPTGTSGSTTTMRSQSPSSLSSSKILLDDESTPPDTPTSTLDLDSVHLRNWEVPTSSPFKKMESSILIPKPIQPEPESIEIKQMRSALNKRLPLKSLEQMLKAPRRVLEKEDEVNNTFQEEDEARRVFSALGKGMLRITNSSSDDRMSPELIRAVEQHVEVEVAMDRSSVNESKKITKRIPSPLPSPPASLQTSHPSPPSLSPLPPPESMDDSGYVNKIRKR